MTARRGAALLALTMLLLTGCQKASTTAAGSAGTTSASASSPAQDTSPAAQPTATSAATPGVCPTSNTTTFAKSRFVGHAGLAFGSFHRYLYKPYQQGTFTTGSTAHRALVIAKAAGTALFIKRETRLAAVDVQASPVLCRSLEQPLLAISSTISSAVDRLRTGDTTGLQQVQKQITSTESTARSSGTGITENPNAPSS